MTATMQPLAPGSGEETLADVERELRRHPPGAQRALGAGIYLRLDRSGRRRFVHRVRVPGRGHIALTFDSWEAAAAADRRALESAKALRDPHSMRSTATSCESISTTSSAIAGTPSRPRETSNSRFSNVRLGCSAATHLPASTRSGLRPNSAS